ncbi:MAG TPA: HAMP domain-containing sensor histidine kinase [Pseudogracilibacillus sp.]|nr:HAMP domain-containing sensor histidine kinase [Pseudogracilibacillus sp.]
MFKHKQKKVSLKRYWTTRYVLTLAIGLIIVAVISAVWIRHTTFENRLEMMQVMAKQTANQIVENEVGQGGDSSLDEFDVRAFLQDPGKFMQMPSDPSIFLVNVDGDVVYNNDSIEPITRRLDPSVLDIAAEMETFYSEEKQDTLYMIKEPVQVNGTVIGWVVFLELKGNLTAVQQEYQPLIIMILTLAALGWLAIYLLSGRLAKPITNVATAAEQVKEGNYDFTLPDSVPEKEVDELLSSFKEMAEKLQRLEMLRSELLAGVTHELKTPVTSISGLIQAVKDGVVEGEEAEEFLRISLQESEKMKKMVDDLVAFNTFVADAIPLDWDVYEINALTENILHSWEINQEADVQLEFQPSPKDVDILVDAIRFEQIIVNLLNNAKDTEKERGIHISISIVIKEGNIIIEVTDNGPGIPEQEQPYIFERFYRGETKKLAVSGFGLGLPFSKMIAQALKGDLNLQQSSEKGTTFAIQLPMKRLFGK